jgi:methionine-rich copper-binding protein CopC
VKKALNILAAAFFFSYCLLGNGIGIKAAVTPDIQITVPNEVYVGQDFDVTVNINNVSDLYGISLDFLFNPKVVTITSVEKGNIFDSVNSNLTTEMFNTVSNTGGLVTYARSLITDIYGVSGSGTLLTLHCKAVGAGDFKWSITGDAKERLSLEGNTGRILLSDSNIASIAYNAIPVTKTVILDNTAPTPSATVKTGLYNTNQSVTLTAVDDYDKAPVIYYTTNGTNPTTSSTKYSGAIAISQTTTLKFIAADKMKNTSSVHSEIYTIDKAAPAHSSTAPANSSTNIALDEKIVVTFSENIEKSSAFSSIALKDAAGQAVAATASVVGKSIEIVPAANLNYGTSYTVTIPAAAVKDLAGNNFAGSVNSTFKTVYMAEDIDKNGIVDIKDIAAMAIKYRLQSTDAGWISEYDLNADNIIDIFDLVMVSKKIKS